MHELAFCAVVSMVACMVAGEGLSPTLGTLSSTATWKSAAGMLPETVVLRRRCSERRLACVAARVACIDG